MNIELIQKTEVEVRFLKVSAQVRYWDDAEINGDNDESGCNVPFKNGDLWEPIIDIENGFIVDWPVGTEAKFHFKVCDAGQYYLLDKDLVVKASILDGYVPNGLCHGDTGFGDYIILDVASDGKIKGYQNKVEASDWFDLDYN